MITDLLQKATGLIYNKKTMKLAALDTTDEFWLLLVSDSRVICEAGGTTTCEAGGTVCEAGSTTYGTASYLN